MAGHAGLAMVAAFAQRAVGGEALLTKPIDFGALRSEIDMRVERAA